MNSPQEIRHNRITEVDQGNLMLQFFSDIAIREDEINIPKTNPPGQGSVQDILSYVFALMGAIAVIVIIVAGIQFVLSQGNSEKTNKARNTIIYAGVGLALAATSFAIVRIVLGVT